MPPRPSQRLELTWFNKDKALIPTSRGKYGYTWVDPRDPRYCEVHTLVETATIEGVQAEKEDGVTYSERADLEPTTDNLLIRGDSGDALEALRHVPELANEYVGKVKLCYIDPPFNTEKTFTNYEDNLEHSIWLTMMRDRLIHIRELLAADGSLWVHLDDSESHRMRSLLDEVFGAGNFMAEVVWQKADSPRSDSGGFSDDHDVILVYRKSETFVFNRLPRTAEDNARFSNPDNDPVGPWWDGDPTAPNALTHQGMVYAIQQPITGELIYPSPGRCWYWQQSDLLEIMRGWGRYELIDLDDSAARAAVCGIPPGEVRQGVQGVVIPDWGDDDADLARKQHESRTQLPNFILRKGGEGGFGKKSYVPTQGNVPRTWWANDQVDHNRAAKAELKALFPGINAFSTPKPERLLERIIHISTAPGDIVLDVFAGSGTTAAVAHKMGRQWVTVELLAKNVEQFAFPRLTKVVRGEDSGGITKTAERKAVDGVSLPGGMTPVEAQEFSSAYTKVAASLTTPVDVIKTTANIVRQRVKDGESSLTEHESKELLALLRKLGRDDAAPEVDLLPDVSKQIRRATRTRDAEIVNWRGGGGFRVMELSPEVFDYDPELELVTLTDAAQGETLVASVAANLGFTRTPGEHPFHGRKGSMRLVVLDEQVTIELVDDVLAHLPEGQRVTIAAIGVPDGVRKHLRDRSRGSVIKHLPDDLFPFAATAAAAGSED